MQRVLLSTLLVASLAGFVKAQQTTGEAADKARADIMKLEKGKVPLLLKGGPAFADWFDKYDADDVLIINGDGSRISKAEHVNNWRSGKMTQSKNYQHDHEVYIYDKGNVAVVTYVGTTTDTLGGKTAVHVGRATDVWVKQDGNWLRVVHGNVAMKTQ